MALKNEKPTLLSPDCCSPVAAVRLCPSQSLANDCLMYILVIISRKSMELPVLISSDTFSASPFSFSLHPLQIVISKGIIIVITLRKLSKIP